MGRELQGPNDPGLAEREQDYPAFDLLHFCAWSQLVNIRGTAVINFDDQDQEEFEAFADRYRNYLWLRNQLYPEQRIPPAPILAILSAFCYNRVYRRQEYEYIPQAKQTRTNETAGAGQYSEQHRAGRESEDESITDEEA